MGKSSLTFFLKGFTFRLINHQMKRSVKRGMTRRKLNQIKSTPAWQGLCLCRIGSLMKKLVNGTYDHCSYEAVFKQLQCWPENKSCLN